MASSFVLDTTAFSALIYGHATILTRYRQEARRQAHFLLCPVVWYETRRGLKKVNATRKLRRMDEIFPFFTWDDLTRSDWQQAADLWAILAQRGRTPGDADLLISVFSARRGARLITSNMRHFEWMTDQLSITVEDWLA